MSNAPERLTWYIAGPIKGYTNLNLYNFQFVKKHVELRGQNAFIPHDIPVWNHDGLCPSNLSAGQDSEHSHACYMRSDLIAMLTKADGIVLLHGWENFVGARAEFNTAQAAGLKITYEKDWIV